MQGKTSEFAQFIERVSDDLRSDDKDAKARFLEVFGADIESYANATGTALGLWDRFRDGIRDDDSRAIAVAGIAFTAINSHITSLKLFMSGYTVASGGLFRLVLEGISLAALSSVKRLTVLDRYLMKRYSPNVAVRDLVKHQKIARVRADGVRTVSVQYNDYHKYAHLTIGTIIAGANLSQGGIPHVGAFFDPARLAEYGREFRSRINFSRVLPNFIIGVARNVSEW
jgi:hypothetical protein